MNKVKIVAALILLLCAFYDCYLLFQRKPIEPEVAKPTWCQIVVDEMWLPEGMKPEDMLSPDSSNCTLIVKQLRIFPNEK
jgi:hypothetical protein